MSWLSKTLTSNIGRKLSMSLTGLFLVSFLFVHLSGNLSLFKGDGGLAFNTYTHFMTNNPVVNVLHYGLILGFAIHIYTAIVLTRRNAAARPIGYVVPSTNKNVSWFSKNMGLSGSVVLLFLVVHIMNFYWAYHHGTIPNDIEGNKDMFLVVKTVFKEEWWYSILYVVALALLGFHLNHGFQSAWRTLGVDHPKYSPLLNGIGMVISIIIPAGFATMPLYFMLAG